MFRDENGVALTDDEVIIFLELSKIEKLLTKPVDELSEIEMWMIFFRYATDKTKRELLNKILEKEEGIGMATAILQEISMSEQERMIYEAELIYELDQRSAQRALENAKIAQANAKRVLEDAQRTKANAQRVQANAKIAQANAKIAQANAQRVLEDAQKARDLEIREFARKLKLDNVPLAVIAKNMRLPLTEVEML